MKLPSCDQMEKGKHISCEKCDYAYHEQILQEALMTVDVMVE